ncbi:MAG: hypothetical protein WA823_13830 [Candidatus Acidiferrales bacterium]
MLRRRLAPFAKPRLAATPAPSRGVTHALISTLALSGTIVFLTITPARATECSSSTPAQISLNLSTPRTLLSPDKKWKVLSIPGKNFDQDGNVFIAQSDGPKKWRIDYLKRRGTVFFSDDSKYLVYREEFLPIDTAIRAFDLTGAEPHEIKHIDSNVRRAIGDQIPKHMEAEYVHYPDFCFAFGDSSTFILLSDTPILPRWHRGTGTPFFTRVEVNLHTAQAAAAIYNPPHHETPPPSATPRSQAPTFAPQSSPTTQPPASTPQPPPNSAAPTSPSSPPQKK